MVMDIKIDVQTRDLQKQFRKLSSGDIPDVTAVALNRVAFNGKKAVRDRMKEVFDNPNPFTLNGFFVRPATPKDLNAWVASKDYAPGGTPAIRYLGPEIYGGPRDMKKSEKALRAISGGQYWIPGPGAPLDRYGNIRPGEITRILSRLSLLHDAASNITDRTTKRLGKRGQLAKGQRSEYFIAREGRNGRPRGIFKYVGPGKVVAVLWFTPKQPTYRAILPVPDIIEATSRRDLPRVLAAAIRKVLRERVKS